MTLFPCRACAAKDQEIERLGALLQAAHDREERQAAEILKLARDATGLTPRAPLEVEAPEPLAEQVEDWLDVRFGRHSALWRQQRREAAKLAASGTEPEKIVSLLARGQAVEL